MPWDSDLSRTQQGVGGGEGMMGLARTPNPATAEHARYRLGSRLGPAGQVYEAQLSGHPVPVAVKLFPFALGLPTAAVGAFTADASRVADLRHPHVVQVLRSGTFADGTPFAVMERLFGQTLEERLAAGGGTMPAGEVLPVVRGIASALSAAHGVGVLHRELRADNVLIATLAGYEWGFAKLLDFGVSRLTAAARAAGRIVNPASIQLLAPEQRQGSVENGDERTDQFALAALTFRLVTGSAPTPGMQQAPAFARTAGETPGSTGTYRQCPAQVEAVLARGMSQRPENRFDSVAAFFRALQEVWATPPAEPAHQRASGAVDLPTVRLKLTPPGGSHVAAAARGVPRPVAAPSLTEQFFVEGERQEANQWADSPLVTGDYTGDRPKTPPSFESFDRLPRQRQPFMLAAALGVITLVAAGSAANWWWNRTPSAATPSSSPVKAEAVVTVPAVPAVPVGPSSVPTTGTTPVAVPLPTKSQNASRPLETSGAAQTPADTSGRKGPLKGFVWSEKHRQLIRSRPAARSTDSGPPPPWPATSPPQSPELLAPSWSPTWQADR